MTPTPFNGGTVYLIQTEPDWNQAFSAAFEVAMATEVGLSNRETRRPMGSTIRASMKFKITVHGGDGSRLCAGLRTWQTEQVAVPFWPAAVPWESRASAPITSKLKIVFLPDLAAWELFEDDEPMWPTAGAVVVPVLLGSIVRTDPVWLTPTVCQFTIDFEETSASQYALTIGAQEWTAGPEPSDAWAGNPPSLMPSRLHFERPTLGVNVDVIREAIGFGRAPAETLYPQANWRRGQAPFVEGTAAEVATLLRFWVDHAEGLPFWVPAWTAAATLTAAVGPTDVTVAVEAGHDVKDGDWLMFSDNSEDVSRVTTAAATTLTLETSVGAMSVRCLLSHLLLCRWERPRIRVDWLTPTVAKFSLAIRELPAEFAPAADETIGTTIGRMPRTAFLYEITEPTVGSSVIHRFTSFEEDCSVDGELYAATKIDHGEVRHGIALDRDEVEVRFAIDPGDTDHPLVRLATMRCDSPLTLRIRRVQLT